MNLLQRLQTPKRARESRQLVELFQTWQRSNNEGLEDASSFTRYVQDGYKSNGVVFGVILARLMLFSEARFKWRNFDTKELSGNSDLSLLEKPWPNGTTGELLARMEQDVSLAGNAYVNGAEDDKLQRLRPDWVEIISDRREVIGYSYAPGGLAGQERRFLPVDEVCHWSPIPDPLANFRGMTWLTPVAREVDADSAMILHKKKFFDNAATPNLMVKYEGKLAPDDRERLREEFERRYGSVDNAYRTVVLDAGADLTVIGNTFEQMSFATVQAAGENRICVAGGVPAIVVGLKEGLQASTYSNYSQAMRRFGDMWARPQWRSVSAALGKLVIPPPDSELWYDVEDIAALREDTKERAETFKMKAEAAGILIRAGYEPADVGRVVETFAGLDKLGHSGAIPVTLYEDGKDPGAGRLAAMEAELRELQKKRTKRIIRDERDIPVAIEEDLDASE